MTLNYERRNSLMYTRGFLQALLDPKQTPRVPKEVRQWASRCLRHFPTPLDVERLALFAPQILGTRFDDNFRTEK
jgi:hypothetical protein